MKFAALVALALVVGHGAFTSPPATAADTRPNVVLITTDDMTDYDLRWMPETRRLIRRKGYEFTDFISPHPLCCPARAEILTGQYAQNNGVHHNKGRWGGNALSDPGNNVGEWLQDSGYKTALVGKFLNSFDRFPEVGGWDHLNYSQRGTFAPYGFKFSEEPARIKDEYTADYVGRKTIEYATEFAATDQPFFIWASQVAPHAMTSPTGEWVDAIPAERHTGLYPNAMPPSLAKPSFNEADVSDKPEYLPQVPMTRREIIHRFRARIRSLKAVDEQVRRLVRSLAAAGELDNTVILFTSDNGFMLGEHRLRGKNYLYEEALQVPLVMRGPGVPVGSSNRLATMVDIAPTIADLADATPGRVQDGTSMIPATTADPGRTSTLIQAGAEHREWQFRGVRDSRWTYAEHHTAEVELYDRETDPYQLDNLAGQRPEEQARLALELDSLRGCAGAACYQGAR